MTINADGFTGKKPQILVTFIGAHIGGAMTALINFLNSIDTNRYDVDVLFYKIKNGERWGIKDEINILPAAKQHKSYSISNILKKVISPSYMIARFWDVYYKKIKKNKRRAVQIMSKQGCRYFAPLEKHYDIAIAFEYTWALNYLVTKVNADKKIAWHHLDFKTSGLDFKVDKKAFDIVDKFVFVSENCMHKFVSEHPQYREKSMFMPNILTSAYVRQKGQQPCDMPFEDNGNLLKLLTVARVSFEHKGIDRGVEAFKRLKKEGLLENVRWTIVGKGRDLENLQNMIAEYELGDYIFPIGAKENPIPYMKNHDALFLPSRHEGKPMVVTEAQIMGLVPVVTNYTSAHEQIKNGVDGIVLENSSEAVYKGVKYIVENRDVLTEIRQNILAEDYGNEKEIEIFYKLADELL